jgi:Flp pilus assembly protein TadG
MWGSFSRMLGAARSKARSLGRDEAGTIVMYAVAVPVFAGVVAVGAETGNFYRVKRQMQNAADAAALSASIDSVAGKSPAAIATDALYQAQRNGFTNGVDNVTVTVNSPPLSGPNVSTPGAVEVVIQKSSQSFVFGNALNAFLGQSSNPFTLRARSVAARSSYTKSGQTTTTTTNTSYEGCLVALTPNAEQGIKFSSFNNFKSDCSVLSNGTASTNNSNASIYFTSFNTANFNTIWTRGSFYQTSSNKLTYNSLITNQTTQVVDPYASLPDPTRGPSSTACNYTNFKAPSGSSVTLLPGTYCGGLDIEGGINTVYFTAGTYYIANGDFYITSVNNISCSNCVDGSSGVTIILTRTSDYPTSAIGGFKITSENNVTLSAPPSGPYKGVLVYQDRNADVGTMTSTSKIFTLYSLNNAKLAGAIYFPNNRIDLSSLNNAGNSTQGCTVWIGRYVKFSSYNNNFIAGCSLFGTTPAGIQTTTTTTGTGPVTVTTSRVVE